MSTLQKIKPIHPFAARMAPEIALDALQNIKKGSYILDPMSGSGTVLRTIAEKGHTGIGLDIDPLSVLMSKTWTSNINEKIFLNKAEQLIEKANALYLKDVYLPWIDDDFQTKSFIKFWFAKAQENQLRKISFLLKDSTGSYSDLLRIALSRIIITKNSGASLAADISHSRPHKVRTENEFNVLLNFKKSCFHLSKCLSNNPIPGNVSVKNGDARNMKNIDTGSINSIITSPPYLNALDYMRGHKFSLVWLGHSINKLGKIRSESVGSEKSLNNSEKLLVAQEVTKKVRCMNHLSDRKISIVNRYAVDMSEILNECYRVMKRKSKATFVMGNSTVDNIYIKNSQIVSNAGNLAGLNVIKTYERIIPENRRYLPPPNKNEASNFKNRMRKEVIITFQKP